MRNWLKEKRIALQMTHDNVAKKSGISRVYYTRIENGQYHIPIETAKAIAEVLNFNWTKFYDIPNDTVENPVENVGKM